MTLGVKAPPHYVAGTWGCLPSLVHPQCPGRRVNPEVTGRRGPPPSEKNQGRVLLLFYLTLTSCPSQTLQIVHPDLPSSSWVTPGPEPQLSDPQKGRGLAGLLCPRLHKACLTKAPFSESKPEMVQLQSCPLAPSPDPSGSRTSGFLASAWRNLSSKQGDRQLRVTAWGGVEYINS